MQVKCSFRPGSVIGGKFEIVKMLGEGSLGDDIYLGRQTDLNRDVTIRILPPDVSSDREMVQRFTQEIEISAKLQHPNILPAYEAGEHAGRAYLINAASGTGNLRDILRKQTSLSVSETLKLAAGVASALDYAWDRAKILHRNLRPESIAMTTEGQPLLTDFGMAKKTGGKSADLTMIGFTIGNPDYMSPEQVIGESSLDCRSDIYCLGLVLYECLAGRQPFRSASPIALMEMQMSAPHEPLPSVKSCIDSSVSAVIDKMLAKDKNARYQDYRSLIEDFEAVLNGSTPSALQAARQRPHPQEPAPASVSSSPGRQTSKTPRPRQKTNTKQPLAVTLGFSLAVLAVIAIILVSLVYVMKSQERARREAKLEDAYKHSVEYAEALVSRQPSAGEIAAAIANFESVKVDASGSQDMETKAEGWIKRLESLKDSTSSE